MENFVITLTAKPGAEDKVSEFYLSQQAEYDNAPGFLGRQIFRAKAGAHVAAVKKIYSAEELAKHPEGHHEGEPAVHFVIIEKWKTIDDRMTFGKNRDKSMDKDLFPLLNPEHTHEFYKQISG